MADNESGEYRAKTGYLSQLIDRISANRYWSFIGGFSGLLAILALLFTFVSPETIINDTFPKDALVVKLVEIESLPAAFLLPDQVEEGSTVNVSPNASLAEATVLDLLLSAVNQSFNQIRIREDNVLVQVIDYVPIDRRVNIWHHHPELGGGYDWLFEVSLDPSKKGMVKTEYIGTDHIDSIYINPKEEEHIRVKISFTEPGIYTFQPVVLYFHKGEKKIVTLEDTIMITVPAEFTSWKGEIDWASRDSISDLEKVGYCVYIGEIEGGWMSNYECMYDN